MSQANCFSVSPRWRIILQDLGLCHRDVLRRADLPEDLLGREKASLTTEEYFRLWNAIEAEADDVELLSSAPSRGGREKRQSSFDEVSQLLE